MHRSRTNYNIDLNQTKIRMIKGFTMISLKRVLQRSSVYFNSTLPQSTYDIRKALKYTQKTNQSFDRNSIKLIERPIDVQNLVPNFFTSNLILRTAPPVALATSNSNSFLNSYTNLLLPLSTNPKMRLKLNNVVYKGIRIGRLFEIMDSVAGIVSYRHCSTSYQGRLQDNKVICVTGSVQSLHLFKHIDIQHDLTVQGYLNHVGNTSMQISINVIQNNLLKASALFTMIARNSKDPLKGQKVPSLDISQLTQTQLIKAHLRTKQALQNIIQRKTLMQTSYDVCPPSPKQIQQIHRLFLRRKQQKNIQVTNSIPIHQTVLANAQIMHSQERNLHGKIFGGYLIRAMIQLGVVTGCKHAQDTVSIEDLTNIYFKKAVDVGCRLNLKAMVTYVNKHRMIVTVQAYTSVFTERRQTLACFMHIIVKGNKEVKEVQPQSYQEGLQYLSSQKAFIALFQ